MACIKGWIGGKVQGVGFRYFAARHAQRENLSGYAINLADGRVEFLLQGEAGAVDRVVQQLGQGPDYARVDSIETEVLDAAPQRQGFVTR